MSEADGLAKNTNPDTIESGTPGTFDPGETLDTSGAAALCAAERANTGPKSIGPYQLIRRLGEGGMGQVWLAEQTAPIQRQVALKLIKVGGYDDSVLQHLLRDETTEIKARHCLGKRQLREYAGFHKGKILK